MWPIVPILMCGLLRSNFSFAILRSQTPLFRLLGYFSLDPANDFLGQVLGHFLVPGEVHGETSAALRARTKIGRITEHFAQRDTGFDDLRSTLNCRTFETPAAGNQVAVYRSHVLLRNH